MGTLHRMHQPKALTDVQFSMAVGLDRADGAGIHPDRNDPECTGRWPKTPERLGCRPAGTSLLSYR